MFCTMYNINYSLWARSIQIRNFVWLWRRYQSWIRIWLRDQSVSRPTRKLGRQSKDSTRALWTSNSVIIVPWSQRSAKMHGPMKVENWIWAWGDVIVAPFYLVHNSLMILRRGSPSVYYVLIGVTLETMVQLRWFARTVHSQWHVVSWGGELAEKFAKRWNVSDIMEN